MRILFAILSAIVYRPHISHVYRGNDLQDFEDAFGFTPKGSCERSAPKIEAAFREHLRYMRSVAANKDLMHLQRPMYADAARAFNRMISLVLKFYPGDFPRLETLAIPIELPAVEKEPVQKTLPAPRLVHSG